MSFTMPLKILVVLGSVRQDRLGHRVAKFITKQLKDRGHDAMLIDPAEYDLPLLEKMYKSYDPGTAPAKLELLATHMKGADAYVPVSAEYNHSIPPALSTCSTTFSKSTSTSPPASSATPRASTAASVPRCSCG